MKIYWNPVSFTPTTTIGGSFAGYPPTNLENTAINLDWFQDVASAEAELQFDFGADTLLKGMFLHKVNFRDTTDLEVRLQPDGGSVDMVTIPADALRNDNNDRTRFFLDFIELGFDSTAYRYAFFKIAAGANVKTTSFYNIGSAYFLQSQATDINPTWGMSHTQQRPTITQVLANGARPYAEAGPVYEVFDMRFQAVRDRNQFPDYDILRAFDRGPFVVNFEYHNWLVYPCILEDFRTLTNLNSSIDEVQFKLRELVTI